MKTSLILFCILVMSGTQSRIMAQDDFKLVTFPTEDGGSIEAALFEAGKEQVVVFAHGMIFDKESWYFLAEKFPDRQISALSIDFRGYGNSTSGNTNQKYYDILGAITWLKEQGYKEINLVGGSMGGAAVLEALDHFDDPVISKIVLLAPAGGPPVPNETINKFFVISKEEGLYDRVQNIYNHSAEPKQIKVYPGNAHAQHLFNTDYSEELQQLIIDFVVN